MAQNSPIEWTDHTWNPWVGCIKVSPGCMQCYMYREQQRYGRDPRLVRRTSPATFQAPLKWHEPFKVFTCSWSDFFIDLADAWRPAAWDIIRRTPHLTYQILTKRPENILSRLPEDWGTGWAHVWLGVSVESPAYLTRAQTLVTVAARVRFISYEPALAAVDFTPVFASGGIHWLISGGESGARLRPADPTWFVAARDQCEQYGVAYFHKQNGGGRRIDGTWGGRVLEDRVWHAFPSMGAATPSAAATNMPLSTP